MVDRDTETVISAKNVYKDFKLPHQKKSTIKSVFTTILDSKTKSGYEVQHALEDISFDIKKGEFFGIVGRNGSGKSTMLKILAGIYQPTKGSVSTSGKLVPFIELGVGFNPELTGRENVYLNGALLGFSTQEIDGLYDDIVEFAELERFMDQKLKNYSSGMQVRLAFSMAIQAEADILLVDEVLAVGDADFQRKCFEYFKELKANKKTVVFVTHDMSAVREYCDRAIMIEKSRLVKSGSANDVATEYVKLFNKSADSTLEGKHGKRWGDYKIKMISAEAKVKDDGIDFMINVTAEEDVQDPVFGYMVKDSAGNELFGSNTKIKRLQTGSIKAGESYKLKWQLPNVLNDGIFHVTLAISHSDGITQHDWWEDAVHFTVFREDKTPYALNPGAEVSFKKLKV